MGCSMGSFLAWVLLILGVAEATDFYTVNTIWDRLEVFNTDTGTFTEVGPLGVPFRYGALALDTHTDTLYMIDGGTDESLYVVDRDTGAATLVGVHGVKDLYALVYDPVRRRLIAGSYGGSHVYGSYNLHEIDPVTGAASGLAHVWPSVDSATFDPLTGDIVSLASSSGDFYAVDAFGGTTLLHDGPFVNFGGVARDPDTGLVWVLDISFGVYSYDPAAGWARTSHGGSGGMYKGLVHVSSPHFEVVGACPGLAQVSALGLTPGAEAMLLVGNAGGSRRLPSGPCGGRRLDLAAPLRVLGRPFADVEGRLLLDVGLPATACSGALQLLDTDTCALSPAVSL